MSASLKPSYSPLKIERYENVSSNQAYHYFGSAKIMGQIGKAFAEATLETENK